MHDIDTFFPRLISIDIEKNTIKFLPGFDRSFTTCGKNDTYILALEKGEMVTNHSALLNSYQHH